MAKLPETEGGRKVSVRAISLVLAACVAGTCSCARDAGTVAGDVHDALATGDQYIGEDIQHIGNDILNPGDEGVVGDLPRDLVQDSGLDVPPFEPTPSTRNAPLFDESVIVEFDLEMDPDDWDSIADPDRAKAVLDDEEEEWVPCRFSFQEQEFQGAACRRKGNPVDWDREPRPQLMVRFNKFVDKGRFLGLRRLNLEASIHSPAPVRDRLAMWLMREAGIQAPRVNHARVRVNGQDMGLYMNIEHVDKEFVEDRFADPTGNLYKDGRELKTNEDINDISDLRNLRKLIDEYDEFEDDRDVDAFFQDLETMMDVAAVVRAMAGEAVLPTSSNFTNGYANFCLYNEPGRGFVVIPWDLDSLFGSRAYPEADPFWHPAAQDIENWRLKLRRLVNAHPGWRERFINYLVEIRDGPYEGLKDYAAYVCNQTRDSFDTDPWCQESVEDFDRDCIGIQDRIDARIVFLKDALGR